MSTPASLYDSPIGPSAVRGDQWRLVHRALELTGRHGVALEHLLAQGHGYCNRIVPGEARVAEPGADRTGRLVQPVDPEVRKAVGSDVLLDLLDVELRGEQLATVSGVDAVVAGPLDGRRGDAKVHLEGARLAQHLDQLALRRAPHDGVVDHDEALAGDVLAKRVELHSYRRLPRRLARGDAAAADVAVLHEPLAVRDAAHARKALGRRHAGLRN